MNTREDFIISQKYEITDSVDGGGGGYSLAAGLIFGLS
jgi:hypothetical protein